MKKLSLLGLIFSLLLIAEAWAQEGAAFIQSAPISVSAEGDHGEVGEDAATMRARAELSASQLQPSAQDREVVKEDRVEEKKEVVEVAEPTVVVEQIEQAEEIKNEVQEKAARTYSFPTLSSKSQPKYFQISIHYLASSWSDIDSSLKDKSTMTSLSLVQKIHEKISIAIGLDFVHPEEEKMTPEEIRVFQVHLRPEYTWMKHDVLELYAALGFAVADYNVRKKISSTGVEDTYKTFGSGTSFLLTPSTGAKWYLSRATSFDFNILYAQYFGSIAKDFGGIGAGIRLQFQF